MNATELWHEAGGLVRNVGRMSVREEPNPDDGPVVLIAGGFIPIMMTHRAEGRLHQPYYRRLANCLRLAGFRVHVSQIGVSGGLFNRHIHETAERQVEEIDEVFGKGTPFRHLGHSLGGVPGFSHLIHRPERVRHVVALGTPNLGTPLIWLGREAERRTGASAALYEKHREEIESVADRITMIRGADDSVAPADVASRVEGAQNLTMPGITHGTIATDDSVFNVITSILSQRGEERAQAS